MPGRAEGVDGHSPPERGRERVEAGKGGHPGADSAASPRPEAPTPADSTSGAKLRRPLQGRIHAVRQGSVTVPDNAVGNGGCRRRQEAAAAPGGVCAAVGVRTKRALSEFYAADVAVDGGEEGGNVETLVMSACVRLYFSDFFLFLQSSSNSKFVFRRFFLLLVLLF